MLDHCAKPELGCAWHTLKNLFGVLIRRDTCLCVCLYAFLSVQAITFEPLYIETSFLVYRYILTISRSSVSIKAIGSRSRSRSYFNLLILCMWLQVINMVKGIYQGEGHIRVKVKISSSFPTLCKFLLILTY